MKVVVYTRFSPRRNEEECESCEVQLSYCREYAKQKGWEISNVFSDEARSGADEYREKLWAAIRLLRRGDILLVYRRDRLARDLYLSELLNHEVKKIGASIVAISGDIEGDSPEAQMARQVVSIMAEYERKIIARRTSAAMRYLQNDQLRMMSKLLPFGFEPDPERPGYMRESLTERLVIKRIKYLYEKEGYGMGAIAKTLKEGDLKNCLRSGSISSATVMRLIEREGFTKSKLKKLGRDKKAPPAKIDLLG